MSTAPALPLRRADWLVLIGYCGLLFGVALISGRPLTLHEAVLPQSAREMLADGDWLVPKKGGEPWLESPPLPQWCTVAIASAIGSCDAEWIVRIGPLLAATFTVCLTSWMSALWYGRVIGLLSGMILATTCEFTRYAWLAEDEIYLCAVVTAAVAWFVRLEFGAAGERREARGERQQNAALSSKSPPSSLISTPLSLISNPLSLISNLLSLITHPFGPRPWGIAILFVLIGATNLVKGLFFGTAMAAIPMAGWLLWNRDWPRISKYVWFWGFLLFAVILAAWPLAVLQHYPHTTQLWFYDLGGRMSGNYTEINQPLWYYPVNLLWMLAPWTFVLPFGLAATWPAVRAQRNSPERFLWCWALLVPLVFSIPGGKHHHYLLHALAPWAILSAVGLERCRAWAATWPRWLVHPVTGLFTVGVPLSAALAIAQSQFDLPGPPALYYGLIATLPIAAMALTWGLHHANVRIAAITLCCVMFCGYAGGHWFAGKYVDVNRYDVALLKQARVVASGQGEAIVVDLSRTPLSGFLELFYLPEHTRSVHNVSFLADERLPRELLLVTHAGALPELAELASVEELDRSRRPLKPRDESSRLVLCSVRLRPGLARKPAETISVSPMQAMHRAEGPILR